ncbi:MAG: efflux RND transporter periplasmic adaptor subunit [Myxococcota bacterium]
MATKRRKVFAIALAVLATLAVVGGLGAVKAAQIGAMIEQGASFEPPPLAVTTAEVTGQSWERTYSAVGTVVAVHEAQLAAEVTGTIETVGFDSGQHAVKGKVLLRMDTSTERAQLASARAAARLAELTLERTSQLTGTGAIADTELDQAEAQKAQAEADVALTLATIEKKTVRAPFTGRLGIREVDPGEVLSPGSPIVELVSVNPVYVEFYLPEQSLRNRQTGWAVRARAEGLSRTFDGEIEVINPTVDASTRNVRIRALLPNDEELLRPGMFLQVEVIEPVEVEVLLIPNSAVLYAPYGNSVFTVDNSDAVPTAKQTFLRLGERRGDLVSVVSGLSLGDTVVSTGAFKLQNGATLHIANDLAPDPQLNPSPENR